MKRTALMFALCASFARAACAGDFSCLDGAKDSGPYQPGDVIRSCELTRDGRQLYHGSVWRWYRNVKRKANETYVEGVAQGEWASWYPNGKQSSLGFMKQGRKNGTWLYWNERGRVTAEVTYGENGEHWNAYYPSGKRRAAGNAVESGKIGLWIYWDKKGKEKARCDYGAGLTELATSGCRLIAGEVEPIGYSVPLPVATNGDASAALRAGDVVYTFDIPDGWSVRAQRQFPLMLQPEAHGGSVPELRVRLLPKHGRKMDNVVRNELARLREGTTRFAELSKKRERWKEGRLAVSREIVYRTAFEPDSPLSRVAGSRHELVTFVDTADEVVLMTVLSCHSARQLKESAAALAALLSPLKEPPPLPPETPRAESETLPAPDAPPAP